MAKETRHRLLHDRAHLLGALSDYQRGKVPALPELELAALIDGIERRLQDIEKKLSGIDLT